MASVNDFGGTGQNLDSPALGGPAGWAAAVAAAFNNSDTPVNSRIDSKIAAATQSVSPGSREFLWSNPASATPTAGYISVAVTTGQNRIIRVSKTDADGLGVSLMFMLPGDTITITDDPNTPPVTGFSRYVVTGDVTNAGTYWQVNATRTDTTGALAPANGVRVRVIPTLAAGGGNLKVATITSVLTLANGYTCPNGQFLVSYNAYSATISGYVTKTGGPGAGTICAAGAIPVAARPAAGFYPSALCSSDNGGNANGPTYLLGPAPDGSLGLGLRTGQIAYTSSTWVQCNVAWTIG